jgi:ABC-type transport system involved in multi-copper enzyme maturation permease subunit
MTFLPIVGREMRVAARLRGTYGGRFVAALLCLMVSGFIYASMSYGPLYERGRTMFVSISWLCLVVSLCAGPWLTCDSLSEEKRSGTLGLLFLTDLRGYDVVIGKLAAGAMTCLLSILAVVPVLSLTLLMGGQTWMEIARTTLVLMASLPLSLAVGLFSSACCRNARKSLALCLALLLLLNAVIPLIGAFWQDRYPESSVAKGLFLSSPACALVCASDAEYRNGQGFFWGSLGVAWGLALLLLAAASIITPRAWQEKSTAIKERSLRAWWHRWRMGGQGWRNRFHQKALETNPYFWLASRERWSRYFVWVIFLAFAIIYAWGYHEEGRNFISTGVNVFSGIVACGLLKIWWISHAASRLGEDRAINVMELLLTTPLREADILRGQWRSLQRMFLWPMLAYALLVIAAAIYDWRHQENVWKFVCYLLVLGADLAASGWLAMWLSLRLAKPYRAYLLTCLVALLLPWILYGMCAFCLAMVISYLESNASNAFITNNLHSHSEAIFLTAWTLLCLGWAGLLGWQARHYLVRYFRLVAATPTGMRPEYRPAKPTLLPPVMVQKTEP